MVSSSEPTPTADPRPRTTFRVGDRLTRDREFQAVYAERCSRGAGPFVLHVRVNGLGRHRLGLSVGRGVGSAVVRNRVKRLIREVFRLRRAAFPRPVAGGGYDMVVSVRPHEPLEFAECERLVIEALHAAHLLAEQRAGRRRTAGGAGGEKA